MHEIDVTNSGERYLPDPRTYNAAMHLGHMAAYREAVRYGYGRRVLDVGCGTGYGSFLLASYGAQQVVGVDASRAAVEYARRQYVHPRLHFAQADAQHLPGLDSTFDFIVASQVIEHVASVEPFLAELRRLLAPGGACFVTTPNQRLFSPTQVVNPHHLNEMDWDTYHTRAQRVFGHTRFAGIPQRCLRFTPDGVMTVKRNQDIREEDYVVQYEGLGECENMLCWGYTSDAAFAPTLPVHWQAVADTLTPFFWMPAARQWLALGLYPGDEATTPLTLLPGQRLVQRFRLPTAGLNSLEMDLAAPTTEAVHVVLTVGAATVFTGTVEAEGRQLTIPYESRERAAADTGAVMVSVPGLPSTVAQPIQLAMTQNSRSMELAEVDGRPVPASVAVRSFHRILPTPPG